MTVTEGDIGKVSKKVFLREGLQNEIPSRNELEDDEEDQHED